MKSEDHAQSYYAATAKGLVERPAFEGDLNVDVCVVGGGFTGVSAALNMAERGYDVVLLEANRIGWGATGRNGGQICSGYSTGMERIQGWLGADDAKQLFAMVEESKRIIRDRVQRHQIDCDLKWGYFNAATKARHLGWMAEQRDAWARDFGYEGLVLAGDRNAAVAYVNSPAYLGGLFDPGAGHLHPLNYCLGLAEAAETAGARLYERSPVVSVELGSQPMARCRSGSVRAKFLVLCGNAYLGHLMPKLARKIMPIGNFIGATVPLGEHLARALIPSDAAVCDWNFILNYYRMSADHRLLFGGLASYSTMPQPNLHGRLRQKMAAVFPTLASVEFDYVWGGYVGITVERTPHFGRLGENVYFAQGYSGTGVALAGLAGRLLGEAVAGQAERLDLFSRLPHTSFPGGRLLRMPILVLAMAWYRLRDRLT